MHIREPLDLHQTNSAHGNIGAETKFQKSGYGTKYFWKRKEGGGGGGDGSRKTREAHCCIRHSRTTDRLGTSTQTVPEGNALTSVLTNLSLTVFQKLFLHNTCDFSPSNKLYN